MSTSVLDAASWLQRWDAQQQLHIPHREERFAAITAVLAAAAGDSPRVLDLGSGPGSLSVRVLDRIPDADLTAVDTDPVLLRLGRVALEDRRIRFVDADLRGDWVAALPHREYDAVVSTTALHWLRLPELAALYGRLAALLRPGGVFLNGDRLDFGHDEVAIGRAAEAAHQAEQPRDTAGAEDWETWWRAVAAEPALADEVAERSRRHHDHPHDHEQPTLEFHRAALWAAGFAEVATVWQRFNDRVLMAVR